MFSYPPPAVQVLLLAACIPAALWDLRFRKIPNWLVLTALVLGFVLNAFLYGAGTPGLLGSLKGMGVALLVYLPLYAIRAMGAGDVKFMAALGSIAGAGNWFGIFFCTAIIGGILALLLVISKGQAQRAIWNVFFMTSELMHLRAPYMSREELDVKSGKGISLPHAFSILLGTVVFLIAARIWAPR